MSKRKTCPYCNSDDLERVRLTWWGGFVAPWILQYSRCNACKRKFCLRFGKSKFWCALIYNVLLFIIVGAILFGLVIVLLHRLPSLIGQAGCGP